jgi:hypothetical protein
VIMSADQENPKDSSGETITSAETVAGGEASDGEAVVASPSPPAPEPPAAFVRLKAYCDEHNLKNEIDLDEPFEVMTVEFRNGRLTRTVYIGTEEAADALLQFPLEEIVFLGEYSAICSYKQGWIEAAVRAHGAGAGRGFIARRSIFGVAATRGNEEPAEIEIPGPNGLVLRLTEKRGCLYWLDYGAPIYLRIEGIGITEHDKAVNSLEDLTNSLFMQIDFRFDSPLTLGRERLRLSRFPRSRGKLDEDTLLVYPRFSYEGNPSSLYWYARSASSMPLLQFLAFYQCIEFFFPQYSRQETIAKIKNVLKDPAFDGTKDSSINVILNATMEGRRGSLLEERKQLGATMKQCVDAAALRDFLNETEERKRYYGSDYKKISDKRIVLSDDSGVVDQTAEHIYDIRCKVVHTKNLEGGEGDEMILPFSKEVDLLMDDVELIKFLARKVLIASSTPLGI